LLQFITDCFSNQNKMKDAMGIGALNLDLVYEVDDLGLFRQWGFSLRPGGEESLNLEEFQRLLGVLRQHAALRVRSGGGSAANTMVALAGMGFETAVVGKAGTDEAGDFILGELSGVDSSRVRREGRSGVCVVVLDRHRDRAIVAQPNVNNTISLDDFDGIRISDYRYLHLSSFVDDGPLEAQIRLVETLSEEVKVSFDPGELYARRGIGVVAPLVRRSTVVFCTDKEACQLTGVSNFRVACREVRTMGPKMVVCKRGPHGSFCAVSEGSFELPAMGEVHVVDNTGAGDVYNAGFLAGMLLGKDCEQCMSFAHRVAVKSLGAYGRVGYPNPEDKRVLEEI
jgi:ribokinase